MSDILYHVVEGDVPAANVTECMTANAANGQPRVHRGRWRDGQRRHVTLLMSTSNGIIHVIDKVLTPTDTPNDIPRAASCTGIHNSLVAAVVKPNC